ncbi:MAG TPA: hypothetical protein VGD69_18580 [Herpetosiphonaceae bacterium]
MELTCPQCGSNKIVPNAKMMDQGQASGGQLLIAVMKNPKALFLTHPVMRNVHAQVCGACGHIQLRAEEPGALYEAYQESLRRS